MPSANKQDVHKIDIFAENDHNSTSSSSCINDETTCVPTNMTENQELPKTNVVEDINMV